MNFLGLSAINPFLLWGALGISAPIIIHLLSKRKYKIVQWAAMDFLLQADKRNRRRIRLEHLILLILRCLAILLLTLLVVRPFLMPSGLGALVGVGQFDRIVMLDDSPSMGTRAGRADSFADAKAALISFVEQTARERPSDTLTLFVSSRPDRPVLNGQLMRETETIKTIIDRLELSDKSVNLDQALVALETHLDEVDAGSSGHPNRVIYLINDMRRVAWVPDEREEQASTRLIESLNEKANGMVVIDAGSDELENLAITEIALLEKAITVGSAAQFEVTVANRGPSDVADIEMIFSIAGGQTYPKMVDLVPAGQSVSVPFTATFAEAGSISVSVTIPADVMPADNERFFAAQVKEAVRVLIVDGDPSLDREFSETLYLEEALAPGLMLESERLVLSGNAVDVVDEEEFAALDLDRYQLIYIANLYRIPADRLASLESWVSGGGGLVFFLGAQVDAQVYNETLYRGGSGLFPLKLVNITGDEERREAVNFQIVQPDHPTVRVFAEAPLFRDYVNIYQWWQSEVVEVDEQEQTVRVIARFTDTEASPAIVEKMFGEGRVVTFTITASDDWSNWPRVEMGPYMISIQDLSRYLIRSTTSQSNIEVGETLVADFDPSRFAPTATLLPPQGGEGTTLQPKARLYETTEGDAEPMTEEVPLDQQDQIEGSPDTQGRAAELVLSYDEAMKRGLYQLELQRHSGEKETIYFAANIDPAEGTLDRVTETELRSRLGETEIVFVTAEAFGRTDDTSARTEIWRWLLLAMIICLCVEQFLGWNFGRKR